MENDQQNVTITPHEMQEFGEFKRQKRVTEARAAMRRLELDLTGAQADRATLRRSASEAGKLGIGAICVQPYLVRPCREYLGADSAVSAVACLSAGGGGDVTDIKVKQLRRAIKDGADICEVTVNISAVKEGSWGYLKREFKKLHRAAKKTALRLNVEAPLLTSQELNKLCTLACDCGITCIKTASQSFGSGADEEDLKIIKGALKDRAAIKADGADSVGRMETLTNLGASFIGSTTALTIALGLLASAEKKS